MVAEHLLWMQQHYWQSRYSISFPRLRPCTGGVEPASIMDERRLVRTICAFRLLAPEIELSLSTRESPWFRPCDPVGDQQRQRLLKAQPGGYADNRELEQFSARRSSARKPLLSTDGAGITAVWKDGTTIWDARHRCPKSNAIA